MENSYFKFVTRIGFVVTLMIPLGAGAWGRRGHQIVGETASVLASQEPQSGFLKNQSFNMGYYANCPDFIWKRPATYEYEKPQHFMDMEIFTREFAKHPEVKSPFELSRKEFDEKFPDIHSDAGRAFWRVRELYTYLEKVSAQLRELKEPTGEARQKLQEKWLLAAGLMAHYVGDLGMPLHVSENYDGDKTGQKGIHSYFEDLMVDELYPEMAVEVDKEAKKQWPSFTKKNKDKSVLQLLEQLASQSNKEIDKLLSIDKKSKREEMKKNAGKYKSLIRQQLAASSLTMAELLRRNLGWTFDDHKFFFFANDPAYVMPGEIADIQVSTLPAPAKSKKK
jgi:hypothetical protein